ncbi:MAG: ferritin family protein [Candidatus Bathyarchaeota archaeon]|nr:MAG: ferritin family protein [Candidatus Bathyarchaeota archaeon]
MDDPIWTLESVLDFAIHMEEYAIQIYTSAIERITSVASKKFLTELVEEEQNHRKNLLEVKNNPDKIVEIGSSNTPIPDLQIVDYLEDVSLTPEADYQQILIYAAKKEKASHDLYIRLAQQFQNTDLGNLFYQLAQQELKHKYLLEKEYDDVVLAWM